MKRKAWKDWQKEKIYVLPKVLAIFFLFIFFSGIIGCSSNTIQTDLALNKLHFQDGETQGQHKTSYGFSGSESQRIKTKTTRELVETDDGTMAEYNVTTTKTKGFALTSFLQEGLSDNVDLRGEFSIYFLPIPNNSITFRSISGQFFFKYRFLQNHPDFAASLMPGIGYAKAFEVHSGNLYASSSSFKLDLNLPMSYRFNHNSAIHFGLCFSYNHYYGETEDRMTDIINSGVSFKDKYFVPGATFGISLASMRPEIRIDYDDEKLQTYFGMQFRLK